MAGWGDVFGKIFNWLPSKGESVRQQLDRFQKEYNELLQKKATPKNIDRIKYITKRMRDLEKQAINRIS